MEGKIGLQRELDRRRMRGEEVTNEVLMQLWERLEQGELIEEKRRKTEGEEDRIEEQEDAAAGTGRGRRQRHRGHGGEARPRQEAEEARQNILREGDRVRV